MQKNYKLYRVAQSGIAIALSFTMALSSGCSNEKKNSNSSSQIVTEQHLDAVYDIKDVTKEEYERILADITKIYDEYFKNAENIEGENNILVEAYPNDESQNLDSYSLDIKIYNVTNGSIMQQVLKDVFKKYPFTTLSIDDFSFSNLDLEFTNIDHIFLFSQEGFSGSIDLSSYKNLKTIEIYGATVSKYPNDVESLFICGSDSENFNIQENIKALGNLPETKLKYLHLQDIKENIDIVLPKTEKINIMVAACMDINFNFIDSKEVDILNIYEDEVGTYFITGSISDTIGLLNLANTPYINGLNGNPVIHGKFNMLRSEMILHGYMPKTADPSLALKKSEQI